MKYLPLREFDDVTDALNFETTDCRVVGGCDAYTTKAAGNDKKLYKSIENTLESQYASLLSFSAGLPPSQAEAAGASLNLSRASPFGPLSQISSRRTFAYLIATLNASHPDYDFSHLLKPSDFRREKSVKRVITAIDTTLNNLRPRGASTSANGNGSGGTTEPLSVPAIASALPGSLNRPATPNGSEKWNPRMWRLIDKCMTLNECSIYSFVPEGDPFSDSEDEESSLWSYNYLFFNKERKRVCYIYLRGLSRLGNETPSGIKTPNSILTVRPKRPASASWSLSEEQLEASGRKRARFWLGDRADDAIIVGENSSDEESDAEGNTAEARANKQMNAFKLLEAKIQEAADARVHDIEANDADTTTSRTTDSTAQMFQQSRHAAPQRQEDGAEEGDPFDNFSDTPSNDDQTPPTNHHRAASSSEAKAGRQGGATKAKSAPPPKTSAPPKSKTKDAQTSAKGTEVDVDPAAKARAAAAAAVGTGSATRSSRRRSTRVAAS